jgi:hypothetical protein
MVQTLSQESSSRVGSIMAFRSIPIPPDQAHSSGLFVDSFLIFINECHTAPIAAFFSTICMDSFFPSSTGSSLNATRELTSSLGTVLGEISIHF